MCYNGLDLITTLKICFYNHQKLLCDDTLGRHNFFDSLYKWIATSFSGAAGSLVLTKTPGGARGNREEEHGLGN